MKHIYEYAKEHGLYFLDSRTIETNSPMQAASETSSFYLGRDEFGRMGYFQSEKDVVGEFISLKITKANGISLYGEMVND